MDGNRGALQDLYRDTTMTLWNGKPYVGTQQIGPLLGSLPKSKHTVDSVDCQQSMNGTSVNYVVSVDGMVDYENNPARRIFTQYFYLNQMDNKLYIASDTFRWVSITNKKDKPPQQGM
jgi:hypothetical protein